MKKTLSLSIAILLGAVTLASAVTIYTENWGSPSGSVGGNGNINLVGWTGVAVSQTAGPYLGIYQATGASDPALGLGLPVNTVYFTILLPSQTAPGMFYTTDVTPNGNFTDINPTLYSNMTFNLEVRDTGGTPTNYFAVQVGGSWYVCTSYQLPSSTVAGLGYPMFTNAALVYADLANVWQNLAITINSSTTNVTIGSVASLNLTAPITGIGIVELPTTGGYNYNELVINQGLSDFPHSPPTNSAAAVSPQYVYAGGGASFLPTFSGTPNLVYRWQTNGVTINGGRYVGAQTTTLTITNCNANDALVTYSCVVTNLLGSATNGGMTLIVSNVPPGLLYAEDFPYVGPNGNLPITGVGWVSAASAGTSIGIYQANGGLGDVFSYSPAATTNIYYTTDTNDTGLSGLPFVDINPASYPAITFQAGFVPGNGAGQVSGAISVYWAVAMNGTWYCSAQSIPISLIGLSPYLIYQLGFNPVKTNWNNLTIISTGAAIGSQASSDLTGNITGAGLVVAHNTSTGSDMNFQNFEIITNQAVGTPPYIGASIPLNVGVAAGGGASFGVSTTSGTPPFTYGWTTNGVPAHDGGRVSGSTTPTLTIANLSSADNNMQIVAFVTNTAGFDESDSIYNPATLTVTNPPVGLLYSEAFPFVGPAAGNYPISSVGWVEAVPSSPNALFQLTANTSAGAVFAYLGAPGTTVYYATTATDTNQSGLPFPNINLASYPNLSFSVDIAPNSASASNVTAYLAVQLNGNNWYVATGALLGPNVASNSAYSAYTMAFNPAAANWKNLTVATAGGIFGSPAAGNLSGVMTGAGLVFVTAGTGGTFNFDNFIITGTGVGGINISQPMGGYANLTWVGNPAVNLQSSTNLSSSIYWQDVPNTLGLYSQQVPLNVPVQFFRLVEH